MSERHGPSRIVRRIALTLACLFALAVLSVVVWVRIAFNTEEVTAGGHTSSSLGLPTAVHHPASLTSPLQALTRPPSPTLKA